MATARQDYENFVRWVHDPDNNVDRAVRVIANLVLVNFDAIARTSFQRSQRSTVFAPIAQRDFAGALDTLPDIAPVAQNGDWQWQRLRHLTVGPFRGFRQPEPFDLTKRIVLFYGPNGSGKTSLCEALEFALLGSVEEAEAKRIALATYLSNLHERRYAPPVLQATDHQGQPVAVAANIDAYRFCFIEKNRIDNFSRIAARPNADKATLIATLFGMEKFNEFVNNFNENMDGQLNISNQKRLLLTARRTALSNDTALVDCEAESLVALAAEEEALSGNYAQGLSYADLKALIGSPESPSRLAELNVILNALPPAVLGITRANLEQQYLDVTVAHETLAALAADLAGRANDVSFKDLYGAVLALQPTQGDHCPACDTPLAGPNHVHSDPYLKATAGLAGLKELAALQERLEEADARFIDSSRALLAQLNILGSFLEANNETTTPAGRYLAALPQQLNGLWWAFPEVLPGNPELQATLGIILDVATRIEAQDNAGRAAAQERQLNIAERDSLLQYQLLILAQDAKRQNHSQSVIDARQRIADFEANNRQLIDEAALELEDSNRDMPIQEAYATFYGLIRRYRNQLPATLIAGLNDRAMMLYNEFNTRDLDADKLHALHLPLTADGKIEIVFRGNQQTRVDALKILSEGHVRCLGLAILLAKALSLDSPLIVFDDAINAIDSDHRRGIRETIFESDHFQATQLIVTCHSHEFIKDIQNGLTPARRNDSQVYLFLNHNGNHQPRVNGNTASRSYVEMARRAKDELNDRGALDASRKAVEMFSEKIWKWLASHEHGQVKLILAGYGAEPALRHVCEALRSKLQSANAFAHDHKQPIIDALGRILDIPAQNNVWNYLNKGTHEEADRDDFESERVEEVVMTLEELEALNIRPNR